MEYLWIAASNVATFILAWVVSAIVTKHKFMREQYYLDQKQKNTAMWIEYIKGLQGGDNV